MCAGAADFPFPFFGAGEATYFEWAEVHVELLRCPTSAEKQAIAAAVPAPLRDSIEFDGSHLMVASDQFVHVAIAETYDLPHSDGTAPEPAAPADRDDDDHDERLDQDFDDFAGETGGSLSGQLYFADDRQVSVFNRDIDRWLRHTHSICPVRAAFRAEDDESGGTELSDWHRASVARLPELLPWLEEVARTADDEDDEQRRRAYMARGILAIAVADGLELAESLRDWLEPGRRELQALVAGQVETLRQLFAASPSIPGPVLDRLSEGIDAEDPAQCATLLATADLLIDEEELPNDLLAVLVATAARLRYDAGDLTPPLAEPIATVLSAARRLADADSRLGDLLGAVGYRLAGDHHFRAAIDVFELLIDLPGLARATYCNALWVIQSDNNGLPVDPIRAYRFLHACVRHGPDNPAIFFNAACIYMELGQPERVLESIEAAIAHGYDKLELMQNERLFAPLASDPDFVAIFERARARG